jgi:hypothetical protein
MSYKIVRNYFNSRPRVIKRGLTLAQAQKHCSDPETSSSTCKSASKRRYTQLHGKWFDGYDEETPKKRRGTYSKKRIVKKFCKRRK